MKSQYEKPPVPILTTSFRIPIEVANQVKALAKEQNRSFNWMLVHLVKKGLQNTGPVIKD